MQEKEFRARLPRTPHDLNQPVKFTTPLGVLTPVWDDIALPGDSYYFNTDALVRLNNVLKPALTEFDFKVDYFFVPMTMILTPFQSIMYKTQDALSNSYASNFTNGTLDLPLFDFWELYRTYMIEEEDNFFDNYCIADDTHFESWPKSCLRLFNMLRLNYQGLLVGMRATAFDAEHLPSGLPFEPKVFPWQLLAYHSIYYKHYRNEDFEGDNPYLRNADFAFGEAFNYQFFEDEGYITFLKFTSCHYVPFRKDYFMETCPSPLINSQSMYTTNPNILGFFDDNNLTNGTPVSMKQNYGSATSNDMTQAGVKFEGGTTLTTQNIRKAFAMEKLVRTIGRAEKNYDSQILAHFGFKVPHDVLHNISYLGGHEGFVKLGEVIATANTASDVTLDSNLGEMAGKGYGRMNEEQSQIKFTAPCHGVVMAMFYITPRVVYNGGFDKLNALSSVNELPTPELDNLGKQPLFNYEMSQDVIAGGQLAAKRYGWQYRWQQYKQKYPFVSLAFHDQTLTTSYNNWCSWVLENPFLLSRSHTPLDYYVDNNLAQILVRPTLTDNIYLTAFETGWKEQFNDAPWLAFQYDPFIVDLKISSKKVSVLSRTGEPSLDM